LTFVDKFGILWDIERKNMAKVSLRKPKRNDK